MSAQKTLEERVDEEESKIERDVEHKTDEDYDNNVALTTLSERQEHRQQMQEIRRRTIAPGVMKLSVANVDTSKSNEKWAIDLEHPALSDEIRLFLDKPTDGWSMQNETVRMLEWYGIESGDPHQLEFENLVVEKDEGKSDYAHGWRFVEPPDYRTTARLKARGVKRSVRDKLGMKQSNIRMFGFMLAGVTAGSLVASILSGLLLSVVSPLVGFVALTLIGTALLDPSE